MGDPSFKTTDSGVYWHGCIQGMNNKMVIVKLGRNSTWQHGYAIGQQYIGSGVVEGKGVMDKAGVNWQARDENPNHNIKGTGNGFPDKKRQIA
jgi:hypothetical protein